VIAETAFDDLEGPFETAIATGHRFERATDLAFQVVHQFALGAINRPPIETA
jgi:hypothetical protein